MQIEKHIKIIPTPTGAVVFFAGQVCLTISEQLEQYFWDVSPVFAKLTTGVSVFSELPRSYTGHTSMAEAIAEGLTKLDEMQAFYGVLDLPEDTYVGEHLTEETEEDLNAMLVESFVVRNSVATKTKPSRVMISAHAVLQRASELAKEAGEKMHPKFVKMAHSEIASTMTSESVQYEDALTSAFASIKEDCRIEAMSMSDSLVEAHQLAQELFEDIAEEYLNELSKGTLASYAKKANVERSNPNMDDEKADHRGGGVMKALDKLAGKKAGTLKGKAITARFASATRDPKADKKVTDFDKSVDKHVKEETKKPKFDVDVKQKRGPATKPLTDDEKKQPFDYKEWKSDKKGMKESEDTESIDEATHQELLDGAQKAYVEATRKGNGVMAKHYGEEILKHKATIARIKKLKLKEEVESIDEAKPLAGDAYWKSKEAESKEEFLKAQRKTLGLPEPVTRGRGKPTNIDRDLLKTRAHSNVEAGKRPTAGFDRNEKIHFVRHLKDHPDFAEKHVSQAGRPVGTTKVAGQQKELAKKKQDSAFSMWAGLGKK